MRFTIQLLAICIFPLILTGNDFLFYPDHITYDPAIPTLEEVVGHGWGKDITD